jgi:hypothetical protein
MYTKYEIGGLHEKHVVATWNLGNHLSICGTISALAGTISAFARTISALAGTISALAGTISAFAGTISALTILCNGIASQAAPVHYLNLRRRNFF